MRAPLVVAAAVAVAGAVFVLVYEPSAAESRVHDWLAVLFIAATAGIFFAAGTSPRRRVVLLGIAYALFVLTALAWFVESLVLWAVLAVIIAAAAEAARRALSPPLDTPGG